MFWKIYSKDVILPRNQTLKKETFKQTFPDIIDAKDSTVSISLQFKWNYKTNENFLKKSF